MDENPCKIVRRYDRLPVSPPRAGTDRTTRCLWNTGAAARDLPGREPRVASATVEQYGDAKEVSVMTTAIIGTGGLGSVIARQLAAGGETLRV